MAESLPNITGYWNFPSGIGLDGNSNISVSGVYTSLGTHRSSYDGYASHSGYRVHGVNFSAELSNSIYGSSTTVTPLSLTSKFYLKY